MAGHSNEQFAYLDTLALWQTDPWLFTANDEDVALTGCEFIVHGILDVHDVEATVVTLTMRDDTHTTLITTTGHHGDDTGVELNEVGDLASREVNLDRVVDLDLWVWVANPVNSLVRLSHALIDYVSPKPCSTADRCQHLRSCIMRHKEGDAALAQLDTADLAQLVFGLLGGDSVYGEAALGVVDEAEVLASLLDANDILEASWVGRVGADLLANTTVSVARGFLAIVMWRVVSMYLAVDLDKTLHNNLLDLTAIEGVLQSVADEDDERHAVAQLVGTWRGLWRVGTGQLVEEPVRWRGQPLLVLLWTATHDCGL